VSIEYGHIVPCRMRWYIRYIGATFTRLSILIVPSMVRRSSHRGNERPRLVDGTTPNHIFKVGGTFRFEMKMMVSFRYPFLAIVYNLNLGRID